jgi:hypothetical protein
MNFGVCRIPELIEHQCPRDFANKLPSALDRCGH